MKAIVYTEYGPPDVLQLKQVEKPTPKDNEILVKVHATTVATGDVNGRNFVFVPRGFGLLARMMLGFRKPKRNILGLEFAGEVEAIGKDVTNFKPGDMVFGIDGDNMGAYAEYKCVAETGGVVIKPNNLTFAEAAAIPNGALTALDFLRDKGNIQRREKVLVQGASGSVGSAAVQLAKHFGAEVTAVCSGRNIDLVKSLGADKVIDYTKEDFTQNGETYDIIFEAVGATPFAKCKHSLNPNGRYLAVAGGMREMRQMFWTSIFGNKKVFVGPASERQENVRFIKDLVDAGQLKPIIDRCYPLEEIVEAHRYVDTGRKRGNVVITVDHQI